MAGVTTPDLRIPDLTLQATTDQALSLASYTGNAPFVLIFTPDLKVSVRILKRFNDRMVDFDAAGSRILAVAAITLDDAREFASENHLDLPLFSDASGSVARELNLEYACHPVVIVADSEGRIRESVTFPDAHVEGILEHIRRLCGDD